MYSQFDNIYASILSGTGADASTSDSRRTQSQIDSIDRAAAEAKGVSYVLSNLLFSNAEDDRINSQHHAQLSSVIDILGVPIIANADLFLSNWEVDHSRSGFTVGLNKDQFLQHWLAKPSNLSVIDSLNAKALDQLVDKSERLKQAKQVVEFNHLLDLFSSPEYATYVKEAQEEVTEKVTEAVDSNLYSLRDGLDTMATSKTEDLEKFATRQENKLDTSLASIAEDHRAFVTKQESRLDTTKIRVEEIRTFSASGIDTSLLDTAGRLDIAFVDTLSKLDTIKILQKHYQKLLKEVSKLPHDVRTNAQSILDSASIIQEVQPNERAIQQIAKIPGLSFFQRFALRTERLNIGFSELPQSHFASVGLPVKGFDYAYSQGPIGFSVLLGKRRTSPFFLPNQGVAFHDLLPDQRFNSFSFRLGEPVDGNSLSVRLLTSRDLLTSPENIQPEELRRNRVWSLESTTKLNDNWALLGNLSKSVTALVDQNEVEGEGWHTVAMRVAGRFSADNFDIEFGLFRIGADYESFANPYLITNNQGFDVGINNFSISNRLKGQLFLMVGNGLDDDNALNENSEIPLVRIQGRGRLTYQLNQNTVVGAMISPNIFRRALNENAQFSETNIFQVDLRSNGSFLGRPLHAFCSLTNLNQGLGWQDSLSTSSAHIANVDLLWALGKDWNLQVNGLQTLPTKEDNDQSWAYMLGIECQTSFSWGVQLRYDQYINETQPAFGANVNIATSLGKFAQLRLSLNYRLSNSSNNQLFGQQNLIGNFL